jgi:plasmid stabilization system protein ParE
MKLRVARSAVAGLDEIWAYIANKEGIAVAERLVGSVTSQFPLLAKNPLADRGRPELREGLRSFL